MKTILVTGGAGFIGSNLCSRLLQQGDAVIAVDNFITSTGENLKPLLKNPNFTFIKHDITKPFPKILNTKYLPAGRHGKILDTIYHLACPTGVPNVTKLAEEMLLTCSEGTRNVLELALRNNANLLLTSSSEVYGDPEVFPQSEDYTGNVDPTGIRSPYEEGKRFSESLVAAYVRKHGLDAKIVRIFNTYGPGMTLGDTRVIPHFLSQIKKNEPLTVQGDGLQKRTFCYVGDLIDGFLKVLELGNPGEVYNLGSDEEITIADLAKLMLQLSGSKNKIVSVDRPSHDHQARLPSLEKVKKLGWEQKITLIDGLKKILEWYGVNPNADVIMSYNH